MRCVAINGPPEARPTSLEAQWAVARAALAGNQREAAKKALESAAVALPEGALRIALESRAVLRGKHPESDVTRLVESRRSRGRAHRGGARHADGERPDCPRTWCAAGSRLRSAPSARWLSWCSQKCVPPKVISTRRRER